MIPRCYKKEDKNEDSDVQSDGNLRMRQRNYLLNIKIEACSQISGALHSRRPVFQIIDDLKSARIPASLGNDIFHEVRSV